MKIYILLAHPDSESFNAELAEAYYESAIRRGHEVRFQRLSEMTFDPVLWKGFAQSQALEPDLQKAQENITWCDKWAIFYPIWWGSVPAIFKGFIDRVLLPGFAFKYHENNPFWDKLLKGKSAHVFTTCDAPLLWIWFKYRNSDKFMVKEAILKFCGIKPIKFSRIGKLRSLTDEKKEKWLKKVENSVPER